MKKHLAFVLAVACLALAFSACGRKNVRDTEYQPMETPAEEEVYENDIPAETDMSSVSKDDDSFQSYVVEDGAVAEPEASIREGEFIAASELNSVYFDFDMYALSDGEISTLSKNAQILADKIGDNDVLVEGHCDERGTIEYNIALGQKRANTVRDFYTNKGIPFRSIATVSYGKEKPVCESTTESCWRKNRRAETSLRPR